MNKEKQILKSPLDLWRLMGGRAKQVVGINLPHRESLLAVYKDRLTYTFIFGREVASIHFDRVRGEIFFKGHNIRNLDLSESKIKVLEEFKRVLAADNRGLGFLKDYEATLGAILADKE